MFWGVFFMKFVEFSFMFIRLFFGKFVSFINVYIYIFNEKQRLDCQTVFENILQVHRGKENHIWFKTE